jgi:hypothetical protein
LGVLLGKQAQRKSLNGFDRNSIDKFPKHFACEKWLIVVGSFVGQTSPTKVPLLFFYYEIDIELRMR